MTHPRRRFVVVSAAAVVLVLSLAVGAAAYAFAGDVPRGTTVLGIDVGGRSRAAAGSALRAGLADRLVAPVTVRIADRTATVQPADIGLAVDVDATVDRAAGARPALFGRHRTVDPVVRVDADRLAAALAAPAAAVVTAATIPSIRFDGLTPKPTYPVPGKGLDPQRSADAVTGGWLAGGTIDIPLVDVAPAMTRADLDALVTGLAAPAVAAPVTVSVPGRAGFAVPPEVIAKSLMLTGDPHGRITPWIHEGKLRAALRAQLAAVEKPPRDATVTLADGKPTVVASTGGELVDTAALARAVLSVLPAPAPRTVTAEMRAVPAKTTSGDMAALGIREQVASFTTYFSGGVSAPRSQNIATVAREVDGAIVRPGETFSLNGHTGPRGYAQGYQDAPILLDGKLVPGVGGGISQFTTTLFNAVYYAGLEDVYHRPHGYYFSRYPAVIESTIFYPTLDFKFRNDSPQGVLIDTSYTDSSITVSIWGTKRYDVSTEWGPRRDVVAPTTQRLAKGPTCIATQGSEGFTQDAWRIFRQLGKELRREKFSWRYDAEPRFVCE